MPKIKEVIENAAEYPAPLVEMANTLSSIKASYASQAASLASQMFLAQDELQLTGDDMVAALIEVASMRQAVNEDADAAFTILSKQFEPEVEEDIEEDDFDDEEVVDNPGPPVDEPVVTDTDEVDPTVPVADEETPIG